MPYTYKKVGDKQCVYKKEDNKKVGCTKGSVKKYLAALHANANENTDMCNGFDYNIMGKPITETNKLKGGKADKMTVKDISDKFGVPVSKIEHQLAMGKKIEHEHTSNMGKATEIAMDHLSEFPDYYTRLIKMEKEVEKNAKKKELNESTRHLIKRILRENLFSL
jgi:hypothetical protein